MNTKIRVKHPTRTAAKLLPAGWTGEVQYELVDSELRKHLIEVVWDKDGSQSPVFRLKMSG